MLSSNLLKSKISMLRWVGGGGSWNFDAEFKFAKIQNSQVEVGGGGEACGILMLSSNLLKSKISMLRGGAHGILMLSPNLLKSKISMLRVGGACGILMLSSNLLKSKISMLRVGWGSWNFDAEFKFAKSPKLPC